MFSRGTIAQRYLEMLHDLTCLSPRQNLAWYDLQALVLTMLLRFAR
jgi:hypothetical protein